MNSIEETDPQFLNKLQQNGLDPYLMNKEQIEKQYLLWNRGQRPTSLTSKYATGRYTTNHRGSEQRGYCYLIILLLFTHKAFIGNNINVDKGVEKDNPCVP
jgi:hypothetical protein